MIIPQLVFSSQIYLDTYKLAPSLYGSCLLNKIEDPIDYINSITKLLPYAIGKKKMIEDVQETDPIDVVITFVDTE